MTERERFEAWAHKSHVAKCDSSFPIPDFEDFKDIALKRLGTGDYRAENIRHDWQLWQACAAEKDAEIARLVGVLRGVYGYLLDTECDRQKDIATSPVREALAAYKNREG